MSHKNMPVFIRWEKFLLWQMVLTEKFPKRVRFTLSTRIDNMALDILEQIIEAAYTKDRLDILKRANLMIEKMRVIFRVCHKQRHMSNRSYEYAVKELYEIGGMLGGWIREQKKK